MLEWLFWTTNYQLSQQLKEIDMKLTDLAAQLSQLSAQLTKAQAEIVKKIEALEMELADVDLTPEAEAALGELKTAAQALDDIVPDGV